MSIELYDIFISTLRWFIGMTAGCAIGLSLGVLSINKMADMGLSWLAHFARAIPIIGLVPVIQLVFGIGEFGKIGLIAWTVAFPVWISVKEAANTKLKESELVLKARKVDRVQMLKIYTIPRIVSGLFQGVEIAIGIGWLAVVASELIATYSQGFWSGGLGHQLFYAFSINDWKTGILSLGIFGLLGITTSFMWRKHGVSWFTRITGISTRTIRFVE